MKLFKTAFLIVLFILFVLFSANSIYAVTTSRIVGVVTDADNGNVLPGVNVILVGTTLGASTDLDGYYNIVNVPPGVYDVQVLMVGYKKMTKTEVRVAIDQISKVNFEIKTELLEGEEVIVIAERDILHNEVSNSQQVIDATQLNEAAGVRTINEYLGAQAGITDERLLEVRGGSAEQTGTIINGIAFVNPKLGKTESSIPLSAIEQVSLQSGGFSAEYGNYRSGILNVITRTGSKDEYHGTFTYSRNRPHMKRFGMSLYDPNNVGLRPYMDPVVSFVGTDDGWLQVTGGDEKKAEYLSQQHESFAGWNDMAVRFNNRMPQDQQATPMDLYLWNAWIHQAVPDFEKLEKLYPQYTITEKQKKALRDHAHEPEDEYADYDLDFGFGGPLPFISNALGDATFYVSHKTTNFNYVQPVMRPAEKVHTTMLIMESQIFESMKMKLTGIYRKTLGSQSAMPSNGDILDLEGGGDTMPVSNLDIFTRMGTRYYWHPTFHQPKDQDTYIVGLTLNNVVNTNTFWDLAISYARTHDFFEPKETRNKEPIINFGPIWVNELPYGVVFHADTVRNPNDPSEYYAHDRFEAPTGVGRRYSAKVGQFHENSLTQQLRVKFDLSSQLNRYHFAKAGVELNYYDMKNDNWRWWQGYDTIYELRDRRKPWQLGGYLQDQISLASMEARIGVRVDYYNSGGGVWPTGDTYNEAAFSRGTEGDNLVQLKNDLESGKQVVWDRWRQIDKEMGGKFLEETKNHLTISPRIGISFPVTERSKFLFNYGHFRSVVPYPQQFQYKMRFFKTGLYELGNPNLEPARTISYELGFAYNLADEYLLELTTYYKDISGESENIKYHSNGNVVYDYHLNNRWEKDQGLEFKLTKNYGQYVTGWLNFWYVLDNNGTVGRKDRYQDDALNDNPNSLWADEREEAQYLPRFAANVSLHSPNSWGVFLGEWTLSVLPKWRRGKQFTWNPLGERNLQNNLRWPDYFTVDMKLSKTFTIFDVDMNFFVDISNLFNQEVSWMHKFWAFTKGEDGTDYNNYFKSLRLPMYNSPDFDELRELEPGNYIAGDDEVGDLRSSSKPYINDPDYADLFLYGEPRNIWFGVRIDF